MAGEGAQFLEELTIWKLKAVAKEYGIDVSSCKYKRDYVDRVAAKKLTEAQVRAALDTTTKKDSGEQAVEEVVNLGKDIERIAHQPLERTDIPSEEEKAVERHIDEALAMKPVFFEVDSTVESAYNRMIVGDFYSALKINRDARMKCLADFSAFQVYSTALSIRAADELLLKLRKDGSEVQPGMKTALASAKMSFIEGSPRSREEALQNLETLVTKTYEAVFSESQKEEAELLSLLADYESFGTRTEEARRFLEIAAQARLDYNVSEYVRHLASARQTAKNAKEARKKEIEATLHMVRASADEAREAGVSMEKISTGLDAAEKAYKDESFRRALELMVAVERAADSAHNEKLRGTKEIEAKQLERVKKALATYEPMIQDATALGMDPTELSFYASNAKAALSKRDTVTAAKMARRMTDVAQHLETDMDDVRIEKGILKPVKGAKCGKCGEKSLYGFADGRQKCIDCGHTFTVPEEKDERETAPVTSKDVPKKPAETAGQEKPAPTKKKWGIFRR